MSERVKSRWRFDPDDLSAPAAIVIAVGFLLICGLSFTMGAQAKWPAMVLSTATLFGYFVHDSRKFLRKPRFWILVALFLAVHLLIWASILIRVERWGLLWFNIMVFELPVFWYLRGWPGLLDSSKGK
jgi:hypothetical protein